MGAHGKPILLIGLFVVLAAGAVILGPIPQPQTYHNFADARAFWGIDNFSDVMSNIPFGVVGAWGLWTVFRLRKVSAFVRQGDSWPYIVLFGSIAVVTAGSAYYHLAPDNVRLFWDRLPITVGFMALFAAFVADRAAPPRIGPWLAPLFIAAGVIALVYWVWTETQGRGDLAPYVLVQLYPILALPLLCWQYPKARYTGGGYLFWIIVWYALAKVLETYDREVFALLGNTISGHSLKHLAAAVAAFVVVAMLRRNGYDGAAQPRSG